MSVDDAFKNAYAKLIQGLQNQTRLPSYMQSDDDFDDDCTLRASWGRTQACDYVLNSYSNCEGGGYIAWTSVIVCQETDLTEVLFLVISIIWLLLLFILLAVSADEFLSTNITTIAEKFKISQSVAGVTLVAFGNGAPDIFSAIASAVSDESPKAGLAFGQLLGGGMFITTVVVPIVILITPIQLDAISTIRNLGFYVVALLWLGVIIFFSNTLFIWEPVGFLIIYVIYALTVVSGRMLLRLQKWREAKNAVFVRPATGHAHHHHHIQPNTISSTLSQLERSNSIKPVTNGTANHMYSESDDEELPCQDVSFSGILADFIARLNCFDEKDFFEASWYMKIFQICQFSWMVLLTLSTPLAQPPWCKALTLIHLVVSPQFLLFAFQLTTMNIFGVGLQLWALCLCVSAILFVLVLATTSVDKEPTYYKMISCCCGFVVSVGWVYAVAAEVVGTVQMLGIISKLSPEILGVTVLGWTNSIGDLVADTSLAKQGYSQMALAAAFGGPLFNLLVGFGLSFTIAVLQGKTVDIDVDIEKLFMYGFMCVSVFGSLTILVLSRFRTNKYYAMLLLCVYFLFMVALILCETVFSDNAQSITMSQPKVYVIGVGMTPFTRPGSSGKDYPELVKDAVLDALNDAGLQYKDVQQATVGYLFGGTCCGQRALYEIGFTGIPIMNVNNACASGSTSLFMARQIVQSGNADVVLAAGFEKMAPGSMDKLMGPLPDGRAYAIDNHMKVVDNNYKLTNSPSACQMFGAAGLEHMKKYGTKREHFAKIGYKNHLHSINNPKSQFQQKYTLEQVLKSREIYKNLGLLECSPTSDGAAAAILVSENFLRKNPHLYPQAVEIVNQELATDQQSVFAENSCIKMIGFDMVQAAARRLLQRSGVSINDVQVVELHDCFAPNELITYEALGMCSVGKGSEIVDKGDNTYGGKWVVNPSGGLISKGHPIGATGVAQCVELCNQLRGRSGKRQVDNVRLALQHNIGIGGAIALSLYRRADGKPSPASEASRL
ncbi:unnamed protein product [Bursaphelenchus okinawaensis]|uniref:propanoyl-CoA C-acyltransferase n=1 Tax=Bursaphelenchus okinawaensis TaxID=465554 RepID=A0A811K4V4_9BILA|nr:unnamed protein product [Bursaphelenchus okinawaensis]CAG9091346.1 unnamed protein product [Bursaphelenchus okinawaensis]